MLTDAEARDLLHAAADTIEVHPAQPLPVVHRPTIWPMLVAAAAVIAVVVTTLALADRGTQPPPTDLPPPTPRLAAHQVPAVIGLDPDEAELLLNERGLDVRVAVDHGCPGNVATGTEPAVGTPFEVGDRVVLRVMEAAPNAACIIPPIRAWQFLRFALGIETAPRFADRITLFVGDSEPTTMTREQAGEPDNWETCSASGCRSVLGVLAVEARRAYPVTFTNGLQPGTEGYDSRVVYSAPYLTVRTQRLDSPTWCLPAYPDAVLGRVGTSLHFEIPQDGIFCPTLDVTLLERDGEIDVVILRGQPAT